MSATLESYQITRFRLPLRRVIGDSQVRFDEMFIAALELRTQSGQVGLGFIIRFSLPPLAELERVFEAEVWPALMGQSIYPLLNRLSSPPRRKYQLELIRGAAQSGIVGSVRKKC